LPVPDPDPAVLAAGDEPARLAAEADSVNVYSIVSDGERTGFFSV
jgi:hypothetical protein